MSIFYVTRRGVVTASLAAAGSLAALGHPALPAAAANAPLKCEIAVSKTPGLVELQALVSSSRKVSGTYRLRINKSGDGSAEIDQSGDFSVANGSAVVSGVSLGGSGDYHARLTVDVDGHTIKCSKRVSGTL